MAAMPRAPVMSLIDAYNLRQARNTREMSNYDPKEMVKFGNRDVSLWTAVRDIISQPAVTRQGSPCSASRESNRPS